MIDLSFHAKNISKSEVREIIIEQLSKLFDFTFFYDSRIDNIWMLTQHDETKLNSHAVANQNDSGSSEHSIGNSWEGKNKSINELCAVLGKRLNDTFASKIITNKRYNFQLTIDDIESVRFQLLNKYGISVEERKKEMNFLIIKFIDKSK